MRLLWAVLLLANLAFAQDKPDKKPFTGKRKSKKKILTEPWNDPEVMTPGAHHTLPLYDGPRPSATAAAHMEAVFWDMDQNGDHRVNHDELVAYLNHHHDREEHAESLHAHHHAQMKQDGHKLIDQQFEQMFGPGLEKAKGGNFREQAVIKAKHMFSLMDLDGDGKATAHEQVKWNIENSKKHIDKEMHELLHEHDYDLSGHLDKYEMRLIRTHRLVALSKRLAILSKHPELSRPGAAKVEL